jgi:hypothetical protein
MTKPEKRERWPDEDYLEAAHKHCRLNRAELKASAHCGCFYCLAVFTSDDIVEWVDENQTALPEMPGRFRYRFGFGISDHCRVPATHAR